MQKVVDDPSSYNSCIGSVYQTIIYGSDGDQCSVIYKHLQQTLNWFTSMSKLLYTWNIRILMGAEFSAMLPCDVLQCSQ